MYINTLISLQENMQTYGVNGQKLNGHVTITTPGMIRCYVQNLKSVSDQQLILYAFSSKDNKGVRIGALSAPTVSKETKWRVHEKNVMDSGIKACDIDAVAVVKEGHNMRETDTVLLGFIRNQYSINPILQNLLPTTATDSEPIVTQQVEALNVLEHTSHEIMPQQIQEIQEVIDDGMCKINEDIPEETPNKDIPQDHYINRMLQEAYLNKQGLDAIHDNSYARGWKAQKQPTSQETPEEIDYLEEIEKKLKDIQARLKDSKGLEEQIKKFQSSELKQDNRHPDDGIEELAQRLSSLKTNIIANSQDCNAPRLNGNLATIYNQALPIQPFQYRQEDIDWVKIDFADLKGICELPKGWGTQPFVTFSYYKYKEILLGKTRASGTYCLGIPDIYHPERQELLNTDVKVQKFMCRQNVKPTIGEYGYWVISLS